MISLITARALSLVTAACVVGVAQAHTRATWVQPAWYNFETPWYNQFWYNLGRFVRR